MPSMTFDALPFGTFGRVALCLDRGEKARLSSTDMKRAVLSFCLWERTPVSEGGGLARQTSPSAGGRVGEEGEEEEEEEASTGSPEDIVGPVGAPIYGFLNSEDLKSDSQGGHTAKTVLASYPRSGNSLLRRLLEEITGTVTGSDSRPDRTLSRSLSVFGMQGEGVVDHRVRVVKTHYPERSGFRPFECSKAILLVRNPFDAIDSYFNMALTNTHDRSLHDAVYEEFHAFWDGMIRNEMKVWERFHLHWLSRPVPLHVVRYEDLLSRPDRTLTDLVAFAYDMSAAEVAETYGDRIRGAPAVVNAGRSKNRKQSCRSTGTGCGGGDHAAQSGTEVPRGRTSGGADGAPPEIEFRARTNDNGVGEGSRRNGDLATNNGCKSEANAGGSTATTVGCSGDGDAAAAGRGGGNDGRAVSDERRTAGSRTSTSPGLYRPRSSGRGVGGSLVRRFSDQQVAWCVREIGILLKQFGYDPVSQGFPPAASAELLDLDRLQSLYTRDGAHGNDSTATGREGAEGVRGGVDGKGAGALLSRSEGPAAQPDAAARVTVIINGGASSAEAVTVRGPEDAFGRAMTPFRRHHTRRDTRPLPLQGEDLKAEKWRRRRRAAEEEARPLISGGGDPAGGERR